MAIRRKSSQPCSVVRSMHAGILPSGEVRDMLLSERTNIIEMMNELALALHNPEPLLESEESDADIVKRHIGKGCGWKFAYAQRFGETVLDATNTNRSVYLKRLRGCLLHCDEKLKNPLKKHPNKIYVYIPETLQDKVSDEDFVDVKQLVADKTWKAAFTAIAKCHGFQNLTQVQLDILKSCHEFALSRYRVPVFNRLGPKGTDTYVMQIRPDERTFIGFANKGRVLFSALNEEMRTAWGSKAVSYTWPFVLTNLHGSGSFVVPMTIQKHVWDKVRRNRECDISGLILEIGPDSVEVKATIRHARTTPDIASFSKTNRSKLTDIDYQALADVINAKSHILARDIGLANTMSHSLLRRDSAVSAERLKDATFMTKELAKTYLSSHSHPEDNVVLTKHDNGRNFISHIADIAALIDKLRARIDNGYNKLNAQRICILKALGLNPEDPTIQIARDAKHDDPFVCLLITKFFHLFDRIRQTKALRIEQYRRIAAVKKNWFGFVTNQEAKLALQHDAVVVREDADFVVIPKDEPKYRGRAFNRLINNGCRGQIERIASSKLAWLGIPEVKIPSFYTSTTDIRFGHVDPKQRSGDRFKSSVDGRIWHADEHAAETIGNWLLLRAV